MDNLDYKNSFYADIQNAIKSDDAEMLKKAFASFGDNLQKEILADARQMIGESDVSVLASRGIRQLTTEETKYFNKVTEMMSAKNMKAAIAEEDLIMPETEIDAIFDYLTEEHPILNLIDFQNTGKLIKILMSTAEGAAVWGELYGEIEEEMEGSFSVLDLSLNKLSAFIPVFSPMFDLGPVWFERWVRTILAEALAVGLEYAIVDGDGDKKPIGMTRDISSQTNGVYNRKTPVKLLELTPSGIAPILEQLSKAPNNKRRAIKSIAMIVSPTDFYSKVYPATTIRRADGSWNTEVYPFPMTVHISAALPEGKAVIGLPSRYFMGIGTGKGGELEYSDEYKFLEDIRVYRIKLYGNGAPKDNHAFAYCDISELVAAYLEIQFVQKETDNYLGKVDNSVSFEGFAEMNGGEGVEEINEETKVVKSSTKTTK